MQFQRRCARNAGKTLSFKIMHKISFWYIYTVRCRYSVVNFIKNIHKRHSIARLLGCGMGCLLRIRPLLDILLLFMQRCVQYLVIFDCVTTALDCTAVNLTHYASAFRRRRHYVFGLSVRPSVRPKPEIPSFDLYMGPLVHPTNRNRFTACPSVRPDRFPGISRRTHGGNSLKFCTLMYLDHLQNWLVYGFSLLIFIILALFWLREMGQIWGFRAFSGELMEEMAWNFARWCILTTFSTD